MWQWSSTFKCPGFKWNPDNRDDGVDINHVFDWDTLDRLTKQTTVEPQEDDVLRKVLVPAFDGAAPWWPYLACFDSGTVRPLTSGDVPPVDGNAELNDEGQYRRLCAWAGIEIRPMNARLLTADSHLRVIPTSRPVLEKAWRRRLWGEVTGQRRLRSKLQPTGRRCELEPPGS